MREKKVYNNIFSYGDVCLTSTNEEKSIMPIAMNTGIVASNIAKVASGNARLDRIPTVYPGLYVISLGPEEGILCFNDMIQLGRGPAQMKLHSEQGGIA